LYGKTILNYLQHLVLNDTIWHRLNNKRHKCKILDPIFNAI
jgi:hypothetical protein